jgi:phosphate transport system protein
VPAGQTPRHFGEELDALKRQLLLMAELAEDRLRAAVRALVQGDHEGLKDIISGDAAVNALHMATDNRCFTLLALHQPVAVDLRTIVSAIRINTDLERVGDLAVNIAEAAQRYLLHPPVKPLIDIPRMGELALKMLRESIEAFVSRDVRLAEEVLRQDDWLDALKQQVFRELLTFMFGDPRTIEPAVELVLVSRHLERVGDHAINIAEDVIFVVDARDIRHRAFANPVADQASVRTGAERRKNKGAAPA